MKRSDIELKLQTILPPYRYHHTLGVSYTAAALAMCHGEDEEKAALAGLLHDCAKYMTGKEMLSECEKLEIVISESERITPDLLHAKLGAYYAETLYGVKEEEVLSAIRCHTTGKPGMSRLEEILFVADYMEPNRKGIPFLKEIRACAFQNLHLATMYELSASLKYLKEKKVEIDPVTKETYDFYSKIVEGQW